MINMRGFGATSVQLYDFYTPIFQIFNRSTTQVKTTKEESGNLATNLVKGFIQLGRDQVIAIQEGGAKAMVPDRHQFKCCPSGKISFNRS